ncbi:vWA domain-containing protein [Fimbriiglobus ruber]|uniref:VWFA domain-containing protein n=1 Tax=Fimbriiglobus ruber TaxID=1908690 RepID=A0A225DF75_9BACT|nr:VWA domain-containing protein [Fimbriiglobus ruber]OWK40211.1 hypothetical protein FRUB_05130 [Fimbriiglobus ruber]
MIEQTAFGADTQPQFGTNSFAENPEPRCPCLLLLDISGSMNGPPINELNAGLVTFKDCLAADALAMKRIEIAIVTFGGTVQTACDFTTIEGFHPPTLTAGGDTPMGTAIAQAVSMIRQRKDTYKAHGISYYRPWIFLITDGGPTDAWASAAAQVKQGEASKSFLFFSVGVAGANFDVLKQISTREPLQLQGLEFKKLFLWLSQSQSSVSRSNPGDGVPLTDPTGPKGWASTI